MARPQQPEIARSDRTDLDPDHARARIEGRRLGPVDRGGVGPVPERNRPGDRPEHDEDKPPLDEFARRLGVPDQGDEREVGESGDDDGVDDASGAAERPVLVGVCVTLTERVVLPGLVQLRRTLEAAERQVRRSLDGR